MGWVRRLFRRKPDLCGATKALPGCRLSCPNFTEGVTQEPTDDEIEAELNTMLGAPAAAAALADVKQEA